MVTIGIQTYNRKDILEIMAKSLYKSDLNIPHNIRIYDDCSTEYGKDFLSKLFPTAKSIKINPINFRADKNMYQMYADFVSTGDDYFFNADSDLIFNNQWLNTAIDLIEKTDGVLSLFNANSHNHYKIVDDALCLKNTVGAAGVFFQRSRLVEVLIYFNSIHKVKGFDWQWSEFFTNNGVRIYCVNKSLVQHIGYAGQNAGIWFDIGRNYTVETVADGQIMNDILEKSIDNIRIKDRDREEQINKIVTINEQLNKINEKRMYDFNYCFKRCIIIMLKKIMPKTIYSKLNLKFIKSKKTGT
ncbi:MAG: glycosyltransferase family 2 protein [Spirochaetaceae bacterium]|jgi:hypothetical protein|nr:glycosyltransferase family 2 protein [Spirochaetaceae bacterium]